MRAAIVLAAGASRRFGRRDKLLARMGGKPVVHHAIRAAMSAPVARVLVVVPAGGGGVENAARRLGRRIVIVRARDHRRGMAASLRAGVAALRGNEREAFVFLGDMPRVQRGTARRLARLAAPGLVVRPRHRGRPGHPVLFSREQLARICGLGGDHGLRDAPTRWIKAGSGCIADVDRRRHIKATRA